MFQIKFFFPMHPACIEAAFHCVYVCVCGGGGGGGWMRNQCSKLKVIFCELFGRTQIETVHPGFCLCTPLVYSNNNWMNKCAHIGRTRPKNVRPAAEMCASGAECTLNFEHCVCV